MVTPDVQIWESEKEQVSSNIFKSVLKYTTIYYQYIFRSYFSIFVTYYSIL